MNITTSSKNETQYENLKADLERGTIDLVDPTGRKVFSNPLEPHYSMVPVVADGIIIHQIPECPHCVLYNLPSDALHVLLREVVDSLLPAWRNGLEWVEDWQWRLWFRSIESALKKVDENQSVFLEALIPLFSQLRRYLENQDHYGVTYRDGYDLDWGRLGGNVEAEFLRCRADAQEIEFAAETTIAWIWLGTLWDKLNALGPVWDHLLEQPLEDYRAAKGILRELILEGANTLARMRTLRGRSSRNQVLYSYVSFIWKFGPDLVFVPIVGHHMDEDDIFNDEHWVGELWRYPDHLDEIWAKLWTTLPVKKWTA